ncbi:MAG: hypothetical protein IJM51_04755 [Clostridia bacterium]|nr:hypothetical protein [Clostridia bacterium]
MKRFISLVLAAVMVALTLCACAGKQSSNSGSDIGAGAESEVSSEAVPQKNPLFTWEIKLDGVDYTLPFDFSLLQAQGYTLDEKYDKDLAANTYMIMIGGGNPKKDGVSLDVLFWNPNDTTKKMSECQIGQIRVEADDKHELILPGGLKFDSTVTVQDVLSKYGENSDECEVRESEDYTTITYKEGIYNNVEFFIYTKDESKFKYNHVKLQNFVK